MVGVISVHFWDFNVTDWTSTSIGKNQLLWFIASKSVGARDNCIWHQDNTPTTPNNVFPVLNTMKFEAALQVSTGTKRNGALCSGVLAVVRRIFLMHLTVLSDLETQVFF